MPNMSMLRSVTAFTLLLIGSGILVGDIKGGEGLQAANAKLPNIVILYADDMGFGDLQCQNPNSKIPTPNLNRLAAEGTRFTDCHSSSGICTPSRYALLQGRYHWRKFHGIVNSFDSSVLDDSATTLSELLKTKGYKTACIGKWHLGWDWNAIQKPDRKPRLHPDSGKVEYFSDDFDWSRPIPGGPLSHGFDYYFGDDVPNFPPYAWFENDRVITPPNASLSIAPSTLEGNWEARPGPAVKDWDFFAVMPTLTQKAEDWIEQQNHDAPFFLYFAFTSPHAPIIPTQAFQGMSQAGGYGDYVCQTDTAIGRVIDALEKKGVLDDTLILFSADNGPETYAYERVRKFDHRSSGPLRGLKRDLWEGGHRVPTIARWKGKIPAGKVQDGLMSQIDFYASIANIVNAEIPKGSAPDSIDQWEFISGQSPSKRSTLIHNTNPNGYAVRYENWVLIDAKSGGISKVPDWYSTQMGFEANPHAGELYNLRDDLGQRKNLFAEHPEQVAALRAILKQQKNLTP